MKHLSLLLLISLLLLSCTNTTNQRTFDIIHFDSGFSLSRDTIPVEIKGEMTHALKFHDKLYVIFEPRVLAYGGHGKSWLYIFSHILSPHLSGRMNYFISTKLTRLPISQKQKTTPCNLSRK